MIDRQLCGWRIRTEIDLPELLPWSGNDLSGAGPAAAAGSPDIRIALGRVPEALPDCRVTGPLISVGGDETTLFTLPGIARYLVDPAARSVLIEPDHGASEAEVRLFLFGTVYGILCFRRGLLPLHAACINFEGRAVAFAGHSGVGKSTLANAFIRQGYRALADDVTVVDIAHPSGAVVLPGLPRLKLWRHALDAAEQSPEGLERVRASIDKFHLPMDEDYQESPLPLAAVYLMSRVLDRKLVRLEQARGIAAVDRLHADIYRTALGQRLIGRKVLVNQCVRLLRDVPVYELDNYDDITAVPDLAASLAARHRAG